MLLKTRKAVFFTIFSSFLLAIQLLVISPAAFAESDSDDIMSMLTEELKLTPDQAKKLQPEIDRFVNTIDQLKADQEKEGADPDDLMDGAKNAQDDYLKKVKSILTPEQFDQYNAIKEKAIRGMFLDLAEIQLMDIQPKVGFSDEQLNQLVPIMGDALFQVMNIVWEHAGERLGPIKKVKIAKKLKHIQKDSQNAVSKVLTGEQIDAWNKYKEQAQKK